MALRSPSGGPFGCFREDFLGSWGNFLAPGRYFLSTLDTLLQRLWFFINLYHPLSSSIGF